MEHVHEYNAAVTKLKMILDGDNLTDLNEEHVGTTIQNRGKGQLIVNLSLKEFFFDNSVINTILKCQFYLPPLNL